MIYLLTAIICSGLLLLYTALLGSIIVGVIGSIGFFVLGIPSALLISALEKKYWAEKPRTLRKIFDVISYALAGIVTMFILLVVMTEGDIVELISDIQIVPFLIIGIISSLFYYFVLSMMRLFRNRRSAK